MLQELHDFIRTTAGKKRSGFINTDEITDAINAASRDLWNELVDTFRNKGKYPDELDAFKTTEGTLSSPATVTSGVITIANAGGGAVFGVSIVEDSDEFPTRLLISDGDWVQRNNLPIDGQKYLDNRQSYAVIDSDNGTKDLPTDMHSHFNVIYHVYSGNTYEGVILPHEEYLNRINSQILPAEIEHPVATIYDDKIEIFPKPPASTTYTYILPYKRSSSIKNGFSRFYQSGTNGVDLSIQVDPASATQAIIYYFSIPTTAAHDAATYTNGKPDALGNPVEMGWNDDAFGQLASRALTYLGFPIKDSVMSLEQTKLRSDQLVGQ